MLNSNLMQNNILSTLSDKFFAIAKLLVACCLLIFPIVAFPQAELPLNVTEATFNDKSIITTAYAKSDDKTDKPYWNSDEGGIQVGDASINSGHGGWNWGEKFVYIYFKNVPDSLYFTGSSQSTSTGPKISLIEYKPQVWRVAQSRDGNSWSVTTLDSTCSTQCGDHYFDVKLKNTTRVVRLSYVGNLRAWFKNIRITAKYYNLQAILDGVEIKNEKVRPYDPIGIDVEKKNCYTVVWNQEIPETMPESNLLLVGNNTINKETINLKVANADLGVTVADYAKTFDCGSEVKIEDPAQKGYTFQGWSPELPEVASDAINGNTYTAQWLHNEYRFVVYTTDEDSTVEVKHYDDPISVPEPTRTGYVFEGWDVNVPTSMPLNDLTIRAKWSPAKFKVILTKGLDFTPQNDTIVYNYLDEISVRDLSHVGYDFEGWDPALPQTMPAEDVVATAQWKIQTYRYVVYTTDADSTVSVMEYNAELPELDDPARREGYTFQGWNVEKPTNMPANNLTIKALWKVNTHTIALLVNEDTLVSQSYNWNEKVSLRYKDPEDKCATFDGWDGEIPATMPDKDIVLNARFTPKKFRVVWVNNPDDMSFNDTMYYYCDATIVKVTDPQLVGYTFTGWNEDIPEKMPSENKTFISQWKENKYKLTFKFSEDSTFLVMDVAYGSEIDYKNVPDPQRKGFQFLGWGDGKPTTMPANAVTLSARWSANAYSFIVVNDPDDVTKNDTTYYEYGDVLPALETPEKEGYNFVAWSKPVPSTMPDEDFEVSAVWSIGTYTLTTLVNCHPEEYQYQYGEAVQLSDPEVEGYAFQGWSAAVPANMPGQNVLLIANMQLLRYNFVTKIDGVSDTTVYSYQDTISIPADPEKEGHTFSGWKGEIPVVMPAKDIVIEAQWTRNNYTAYFVVEEGDTISQTYAYGDEVVAPTAPEKVGYTFIGWSGNIPEVMPAKDFYVEAEWRANTYRLVIVANEGDTAVKKYQFGASVDELTIPEKTGYTFEGWSKSVPSVMPAADDTIVAKWKVRQFTVSWVVETDTTVVAYDFEAEINKIADPVKKGYTFDGWNAEVASKMPAKNLTYIATFVVNTYELTVRVDDEVETSKYSYGEAIEQPESPTKEGHEFAGWSVAIPDAMPAENVETEALWTRLSYTLYIVVEDDTFPHKFLYEAEISEIPKPGVAGKTFLAWSEDLPTTMPAHDVTVSALFSANSYQLIVKSSEQEIDTILNYRYGEEITKQVELSKTGYTFIGWDAEYPSIMPDSNVTLTAQWQINEYNLYVIVEDDTTATVYEYEAEIEALENPEKKGFTFVGWSAEVPATMPAADVTIEAQFVVDTFTFTTIVDEVQREKRYTYGEIVETPEDPSKEGHTFVGWSGELPSVMPDSNVVVNALWSTNSYRLTFLSDGDTVESNLVPFGESIEAISIGDKEGYTFAGWSDNLPATMPASDITVESQWRINTHNFTYVTSKKTISVSYSYGDSIQIPADPTRKGFAFVGWSAEIPAVMPDNDVKVNAMWEAKQYNVSVMMDGALLRSMKVTYGDSLALPKKLVKCGYVFTGWDRSVPASMPAKDLTFNAKFRPTGTLIAYSEDGMLYVSGIPKAADVIVLDVLGRMVYRGKSRQIPIHKYGSYIVRAIQQEVKVIVK